MTTYEDKLIDGYCLTGGAGHIFEYKGIQPGTEVAQARSAVAQLYEYRYRLARVDLRFADANLWLVLSAPFVQSWIAQYLIDDRHIGVLWVESGQLSRPSYTLFDQIARGAAAEAK